MGRNQALFRKTGRINEFITHIDLLQYEFPGICSSYLFDTPESLVIMDVGTSNEIEGLINYLETSDLLAKANYYLLPSHYHFDHFGGGWLLWTILKEKGLNATIITTEITKKELQHPETHLKRAERTFGSFVGEMHSIPEEAFWIAKKDVPLEIPNLNTKIELKLVSSPGHTPDHVCPTIFENNQVKFMYVAEAAGTLFNTHELKTLPSSMPPEFNFTDYINNLKMIIKLNPENIGYCHFGVVVGQTNVQKALQDNLDYSFYFRDYVKSKYAESGRTRHVVEQFLKEEMEKRTDYPINPLFQNVVLALIYGQLIDLGIK